MEVEENELDDSFIDALLRDTAVLIPLLGTDSSGAGIYSKGTLRYQRVANSHEQLNYIEKELGVKGRTKWEKIEVPSNRRNGDYLSGELGKIKKQLKQMGEDR